MTKISTTQLIRDFCLVRDSLFRASDPKSRLVWKYRDLFMLQFESGTMPGGSKGGLLRVGYMSPRPEGLDFASKWKFLSDLPLTQPEKIHELFKELLEEVLTGTALGTSRGDINTPLKDLQAHESSIMESAFQATREYRKECGVIGVDVFAQPDLADDTILSIHQSPNGTQTFCMALTRAEAQLLCTQLQIALKTGLSSPMVNPRAAQ